MFTVHDSIDDKCRVYSLPTSFLVNIWILSLGANCLINYNTGLGENELLMELVSTSTITRKLRAWCGVNFFMALVELVKFLIISICVNVELNQAAKSSL